MTLGRYRSPAGAFLVNLALLAFATIARRPFAWLFARLRRPSPVGSVVGLEHVPESAGFVLALNHLSDGASGAVVIAALDAIREAKPTVIERVMMVGGRREPTRTGRLARWSRAVGARFAQWFIARWREHFTVIAMAGARADLGALRAWKRVANERVSVVFPEGIAGVELRAMRPGVGLWLSSFEVCTIPCAVWFDAGRWNVRFGPPLDWSPRRHVRDAQLGLALASLLPESLQGRWSEDLARVRSLRARAQPRCEGQS